MRLSTLCFAAAVMFGGASHAATVVAYDEAFADDAGNVAGFAAPLGTIGAGDNSTAKGGTNQARGDRSDFYSFTATTDFVVSVLDFTVSSGVTGWRLFVDDGDFGGADQIGAVNLASGDTPSNLFGTITAGSYFLRVFEPSVGATTSYSFEVASTQPSLQLQSTAPAVPLPAGAPLLIGGLGLMAWMRRRQKA